MNKLQEYVDGLFAGRKNTKEMRELHDEILGNLEAEIRDQTDAGVDYRTAFEEATAGIRSIDALIGDGAAIFVNRCKREAAQVALLYCLIAWVLLMPVSFVRYGILLDFAAGLLAAAAAVVYIVLLFKKDGAYLNATAVVDMKKARRVKNAVWVLWGLLMLLSGLATSGLHFASNLWFRRPVKISGPYQFAVLAAEFVLPFISVLIPLFLSKVFRLMRNYEVTEE